MRTDLYNTGAPKKATNLSVNSDLLEQAKSSKINLSQTLEQALAEKLRDHRKQQWLAENRAALDHYNQRIENDGVFSDGLRQFQAVRFQLISGKETMAQFDVYLNSNPRTYKTVPYLLRINRVTRLQTKNFANRPRNRCLIFFCQLTYRSTHSITHYHSPR